MFILLKDYKDFGIKHTKNRIKIINYFMFF